MPIKPTKSETEQEFIGRCMSEEATAFPDKWKRHAVCISYWEKNLSTQTKVNRRFSKFKGITLTKLQNGLEDSCWPGWKALGTKILDGREVPNCIPEEDHPDFKD
jgi:hypothetical protein